jgi:glycosyltransferase involved in cell wall biosynthesis
VNILWLSHFLLYPETGFGALQRSRNLLRELCRRHEVTCLSLHRADRELAEEAAADLGRFCRRVRLVRNPGIQGPRGRLGAAAGALIRRRPVSVALYDVPAFQAAARQAMASADFDLVYADTLGLAEPLLRDQAVPRVLNHHNVESNMMRRRARREHNPGLKFLLRIEAVNLERYERRWGATYDAHITVSPLDRERLLSIIGPARVEVVENGVDCGYFQFHPRSERCRGLVFAGGLDWYPNRDAMRHFCREIWPLLEPRPGGLTLSIIGGGRDPVLERFAAHDPAIHLHGFVADLRPALREAAVFVCPMRDGGGTKLKILDAMAQGVPVISTSLGCEGLEVVPGEHLLVADAPGDFAGAVARLHGNVGEQNRLAGNARALVQDRYAYEVLGRRMDEILHGLIRPEG